ncbi:MAG: 2-amino-4-hydroxy-6-hydroxymethyldihydropteridine diphosphokinase [Omnitrophica WOR_2 bacterium RIFCSPLOWO2_02_FULL_63_16]|nr:MAG: 2-amino-4-hydroxy-6-hydroxymethyldihydropteridine diphosphokinase [Omnitrophica WOR_2 bacterium GWA2_63_20]OGX17354.1 MAG: 2-amino-4-hydroxy-6-hydroxymethyldihydropteridine diphosphokinase [Omnitrophica WOR_2 bacterium GWF2_63_9]OGX32814.1 MAG: 2-amino-4-hydroxy-6-hydroxymethyldihydropteridine diphosphokinase [Omnitrophica WOR_2 bacterium RIFCSPHIGHO2_12_FULL_64_13]OGX36588.1 MAG: 2-amino-4-hydroxy-6-hydroxymethyldihydropteridine diphosphokinase [Omnitrophica WOR_2 bacterium RIFCSPHIGHO2
MARVFLGIGTNEGDRLENISRATQILAASGAARLIQMATIAETPPLGPPQRDYLNTVVEVETTLPPQELLECVKRLEQQLGRAPSSQRWGPRIIDVDILLYEDRIVEEERLTIPHPQLHQRRFVLEPLAQLAPDLVHPVLKRTVQELLEELTSTKHPRPAERTGRGGQAPSTQHEAESSRGEQCGSSGG